MNRYHYVSVDGRREPVSAVLEVTLRRDGAAAPSAPPVLTAPDLRTGLIGDGRFAYSLRAARLRTEEGIVIRTLRVAPAAQREAAPLPETEEAPLEQEALV